ncbi:GntR family transcriptional regulator [Salisediminibacterium halotolerans]|uniref:GntR family transcriptional regulator n=1 Tax=Salisediminibacterium halotolerans TaxID=517425 RepID=UPI000EB4FC78|nr:GntR family transcriptional regulator [Salisediminibacterium halotolerans]RLJ72372.1 GntR family transcriptional regulator [Actinophytocola xinjiangensis]RPE85587.1 GntR family transcriptional regulator [Salisediminibacterium halotolerans]TWG33541.1 GntR family transcriptional regulator [Salisediminibacterium halotolerans]GEL08740.1 HTH-type transcriptional repressor YtrA [Salisediminibacterium halotolerans]
MFFHTDSQSSSPIYVQLIEQIKELIVKGVLQPGEQLPSVRELSKQMVVNPNTVSKAYQELERQNVIYSESGIGSFISAPSQQQAAEQQTKQIKNDLRKVMIDGFYYGIEKETFQKWIEEIDSEFRRPST